MAQEDVTRKLAAIFYADVAGYSRLTGQDEEGTHRRVSAYLDAITEAIVEHNGVVLHFAGDAILADFATVSDALICAVNIQNDLDDRNGDLPADRKVQFRIGVNLGEVIVDRGEIFGNGVNVAARLESLAKPGGICISAAVFDSIGTKLPLEYEFMGEQSVKNIAEPVRAYTVLFRPDVAMPAPSKKRRARITRHVVAAIALCGSATFAGALWWWQPWSNHVTPTRPDKIAFALPSKPSIAILPFANLSGDTQQEYFADGFTEDLITNVAQSKELFVIARNSTFTYKGRSVKVRQVAEELGVRFVLEGSIRRIGENIRITAQLIDATNGSHVWARRYDTPTDKLFDVQDEVTAEIAGTLLSNIRKADLARASEKRPANLSAYDYVLRARAKFDIPGKTSKREARAFAEKAIAIDPSYAPAYAVLGETYNSAYILQWEGNEALVRAHDAARRAVDLDPSLSTGHELLGRVFLRQGRHDEAIIAIERAIALNPNRARHYATLADALTFANRPKEAIDLMKNAMRRDPNFPVRYNMYLGRAYYFAKEFDKAEIQFQSCLARPPIFRPCLMYLAPTYAELGKTEAANQVIKELLGVFPEFSIDKSVVNHLPFVPSAMTFFVGGLRAAGAPE